MMLLAMLAESRLRDDGDATVSSLDFLEHVARFL